MSFGQIAARILLAALRTPEVHAVGRYALRQASAAALRWLRSNRVRSGTQHIR